MTKPKPAVGDASVWYQSPLAGRYASKAMQAIWSEAHKIELWRRLWLALAQAQHELGLPVTQAQIEQIRAHLEVTPEDLDRARAHEQRLRHDIMAHVHALGDVAPDARGIIHLGATSQDIGCNADLARGREALDLTCTKTARIVGDLAQQAHAHRDLPCLGFTHFQPAQPTTLGKRCAMWGTDLALCLEHLEFTRDRLRFRGIKGAAGTQASFLGLFDGDAEKVAQLEARVARSMGWAEDQVLQISGQTYPRVFDAFLLNDLASVASVVHKIATDVRLMCHLHEVDEPFEEKQIGSSAMPYKRNPMRCERATALARFVMSMAPNALNTAATQWLERTLDDSANRRLSLPEAFLALDGALDLMHNVVDGLVVHEGAIARNLRAEMPFLASERLMLEATRQGGDRQNVHEAIRKHAQEAARRIKDEGAENDLLDRLKREPLLEGVAIDEALDPALYVGLAPQQAQRFCDEVAAPLVERYGTQIGQLAGGSPQV